MKKILGLFLLLISVSGYCTDQSSSLFMSPAGVYHLNGSAQNEVDHTTCTVTGAAYVQGLWGQCAEFTGDGQGIATDTPAGGTSYTSIMVCGWINPSELAYYYECVWDRYGTFYDVPSENTYNVYLVLGYTDEAYPTKGPFMFGYYSDFPGEGWQKSFTNTGPALNKWTFVTGIYCDNYLRLYYNTVLQAETLHDIPSYLRISYRDRIGISTPGGECSFRGKIEDVTVYVDKDYATYITIMKQLYSNGNKVRGQ